MIKIYKIIGMLYYMKLMEERSPKYAHKRNIPDVNTAIIDYVKSNFGHEFTPGAMGNLLATDRGWNRNYEVVTGPTEWKKFLKNKYGDESLDSFKKWKDEWTKSEVGKNIFNELTSHVFKNKAQNNAKNELLKDIYDDNFNEIHRALPKTQENIVHKEFKIEGLYFPPEENERIQSMVTSAIKNGKHIILTGPPGTGKSKLAKEICEHYIKENMSEGWAMATATHDWSTFETIGGYRLTEGKELAFSPGLILKCFKDGRENINNWQIIDEINRADIDKAFGPLFSVITGDDCKLPYTIKGESIKVIGELIKKNEKEYNDYSDKHKMDTEFIISPNWRLIATMNTYDKSSLYDMSYAFMRRFAFILVGVPEIIDEVLIREYRLLWEIGEYKHDAKIVNIWKTTNEHRKVGPAIIEDIIKTTQKDGGLFAHAVAMYILPQFEGIEPREIVKFMGDIASEVGEKRSVWENYARQFFGIDEPRPDD